MKKKRFIKLVMSYGIQHREATRLAADVRKYGSYEKLLQIYRPALAMRASTMGISKIAKIIEKDMRRCWNELRRSLLRL